MTVVRYCTPEWLANAAAGYEQSPRFRQEMAKLSTKICFKIKAEPAWGIDEDIIFWAHIDHGELQKLEFVSQEEAFREADFVLAASPQQWKSLLRKESKFVADFMLGRVTLEHGSKVGVLSVAPHSNSFVDALTQDELQFPDEMTPEELDQFRADVQQFRAELGV
jgi:putative sterol carrier protein